MKKISYYLIISLLCTKSFSQSSEIKPNDGISVKTTNTTTGLFGSSGHGISLQQNWPTIGFNQYRDVANVQRYIGTGFAMGNTVEPATGNMYWTSIPSGTAGNSTPPESTVMSLTPSGVLSMGGLKSTIPSLSFDGAANITAIVSNASDDGALKIYSPMTGIGFSGSQFLSIDKDAIQARKTGIFPSFIKSEQNLKLNPYGGNVGIGTNSESITSTLYVIKSANSFGGTAVFKGTTHFSHFHYGTNEDTYIRGGKNGSHVIINDGGLGNVGIGRYPTLYKLEVQGTMKANEVIVESTWADFVFDEKYKLKSLSEVDRFIKENKHLPDVPSADEIQKNGAKLAELTTKMMQKIEELTLYVIQLEKEIDILKAKN